MSAKIIKCKSCGNEIASNAKTCPNCGAKNSKPIFKKWWFWLIIVIVLIIILGAGSGDEGSSSTSNDAGQNNVVQTNPSTDGKLGSYSVDIKNARLTKDYEGKPVVVITYGFTNNASEPAAFWLTIEDRVYQNGVGLEKAYVLANGDPYDEANQNKEIKSGVSIDVDVAYVLNDSTTDIDVEVKEYMSFSDDTVTKSFSLK